MCNKGRQNLIAWRGNEATLASAWISRAPIDRACPVRRKALPVRRRRASVNEAMHTKNVNVNSVNLAADVACIGGPWPQFRPA